MEYETVPQMIETIHLNFEMRHLSSMCVDFIFSYSNMRYIHRQNANKNQAPDSKQSTRISLLEKTCELIRNFPEYVDVVVSVARKTDGRHWADLFSAAGRSTEYVC